MMVRLRLLMAKCHQRVAHLQVLAASPARNREGAKKAKDAGSGRVPRGTAGWWTAMVGSSYADGVEDAKPCDLRGCSQHFLCQFRFWMGFECKTEPGFCNRKKRHLGELMNCQKEECHCCCRWDCHCCWPFAVVALVFIVLFHWSGPFCEPFVDGNYRRFVGTVVMLINVFPPVELSTVGPADLVESWLLRMPWPESRLSASAITCSGQQRMRFPWRSVSITLQLQIILHHYSSLFIIFSSLFIIIHHY